MLRQVSHCILLSVVGLSFTLLVSSYATTLQAEPSASKAVASDAKQASATKPAAADPDEAKKTERFAKLEKTLSGVTLVGHSTETGVKETKLTPERYELKSVKHVGNDQWLFSARITYGEHDVILPLTLPIRWAGDTPVITVDNLGFPGLGTFTARVMIYSDHYAGFWSGGDHGGHLFGVLERESK